MSQTPDEQQTDPTGNGDQQRVVVVTQDGMGVAPHRDGEDGPTNPADLVEQPAKVMRIGSMIKQLLEEVRNAPLDEAGRARLAEIHRRSIKELEDGLAPELIDELERIALPFNENVPPPTPSSASRRPSSSGGSRGCSTASRPRSSPSRWPPSNSSSRSAAPCRPATPPRAARAWRVCRVLPACAPTPARAAPPASTSRPGRAPEMRVARSSHTAYRG